MFERLLLATTFTVVLSLLVNLKAPGSARPVMKIHTLEQPTAPASWQQRSFI